MIQNKFNIFFLEGNEQSFRELNTRLLDDRQQFSFDIEHIDHAELLIERLAHETPEVIMVDLNTLDGLHGLEKLSTSAADNIPIIILTEKNDEETAIAALQHGARDYLVKDKIDSEVLARSLRYAKEHNQLLGIVKKNSDLKQRFAFYDPLTDLPNRQLFFDRLNQAIAQAKRDKSLLSIIFLDINGFKQINDTLGHRAGDMILKNVAVRLSSNIRESDTVARIGSDEFAIILTQINAEQDVVGIVQKMIALINRPIIIDGVKDQITTSIGISVFPNDSSEPETLLRNAELAHQRAKKLGRNTFQFYNSMLDKKALARIEMERQLRYAILNDELTVFYQPQINIATGQIVGLEALIRWIHPEKGVISPGVFIPIAEESGLIMELGEFVLNKACRQAQAWLAYENVDLRISVNLAARQFRDENLPVTIAKILDNVGLDARHLELEITESQAMDSVEHTVEMLNRLRGMNVRLSLDDFGTGYSSLNYLKRFPINVLKVDRSFVSGIPENHDDCAITSAIIALAQKMGMEVIAEGVETPEQLEFLRLHNCDVVQGFLFSPPKPADVIEKFLPKDAMPLIGEYLN